jgi:hypothetical protein
MSRAKVLSWNKWTCLCGQTLEGSGLVLDQPLGKISTCFGHQVARAATKIRSQGNLFYQPNIRLKNTQKSNVWPQRQVHLFQERTLALDISWLNAYSIRVWQFHLFSIPLVNCKSCVLIQRQYCHPPPSNRLAEYIDSRSMTLSHLSGWWCNCNICLIRTCLGHMWWTPGDGGVVLK